VARFLFAVWPFPTHLFPSVAVAHALRRRGHEAAFYTGASVRRLLEGEGFRCFPFERVEEARAAAIVFEGLVPGAHRPFRVRRLWREWLLGTAVAQVEDLDRVLRRWSPEAVVCDLTMWGPPLVLHESRGVPVAMLSHVAPCLLPGSKRVFGLSLGAPRGSLGIRTALAQVLVRLLSRGIVREASALRHGHGLPPLRTTVTEFAGTMPLYLVPNVAEFDFERGDLPPSVRYVGPCLWEPGPPAPAARAHALPLDPPVVLVTEGSLESPRPMLPLAAIEALGGLPLRVVVACPSEPFRSELARRALPENVRVERAAGLRAAVSRASVVVTPGSSDVVLAALAAGTPLVVAPSAWDQPANAQRVRATGVGLALGPGRRTRRLREAVLRVLGEPSFAARARTLAAAFARSGGPAGAAALLEQLAPAAAGPRREEKTC
jgi:UDP:flavonoid glycosyltransferase YjiC (YdhE family)